MQPESVVLIPEVPPEILDGLIPSSDVAINSTRLSIKWMNELASELPARYRWRFRTAEAFDAEFKEIQSTVEDMLPLNRLYWEDALRNCEAYSIMATWRIVELARSCVWALARGDLLCAAVMARSALESTVQYVDFARTVHATLGKVPAEADLRLNRLRSQDFEDLLLKTVFASKMSGDEGFYKPTNILTIISRIAKSEGQQNVAKYYELLCEIAHPNYLGRSVHLLEVVAGSRPGDEIRIIGPGQTPSSPVIGATVGALSWACATHVSSFGLMRSSIKGFLKRLS